MIRLSPVFVALFVCACTPTSVDPQVPGDGAEPAASSSTPVVEAEPPEPGADAANAGGSGPVSLNPLRAPEVEVGLGVTLTWGFESHGSVGKGGGCSSSDAGVVRFVGEEVIYDNPEDVQAGMSGADGGQGVISFETVGAGTAEITCEVDFRGSVERTDSFSITVAGTE